MATASEEDSTAPSDKGRLNASGSEGRATASAREDLAESEDGGNHFN